MAALDVLCVPPKVVVLVSKLHVGHVARYLVREEARILILVVRRRQLVVARDG